MSPSELCARYTNKTIKLCDGLSWYYRASGAMAYREEMRQEGLGELWVASNRFDPWKQVYTRSEGVGIWQLVLGDFGAGNFWLYASQRVRGRCIDYLRKERLIIKGGRETVLYKERFRSLGEIGEIGYRDGVERYVEEREEGRAYARRVGGLSERERGVVDRVVVEEMGVRDVARELGVTVGEVKEVLEGALRKLREGAGAQEKGGQV